MGSDILEAQVLLDRFMKQLNRPAGSVSKVEMAMFTPPVQRHSD
jgi:hypothetical protein